MRKKKRAVLEKECTWCGRSFRTVQRAQQYCSEFCAHEAALQQGRERRAHGRRRKMTDNMAAIARINSIARQHGLSYGKYIASTLPGGINAAKA